MTEFIKPPELIVQTWLNTESTVSLETLRGKVVVIFAFQLLCPACVQQSIPQAKRVHSTFGDSNVVVIGLHTVFEHHAAMTEVTLKAFMYENRILFPVGIDMPSSEARPLPQTMSAYQMQGTPSLLLIDKQGHLREHKFGHEQDLVLGAKLTKLLEE